jgi:hypothetical protein
MNGYVKLWRKMLKHGMMQNPELLRFWIWCLLKASHQDHETLVGYKGVKLGPGQFIYGRNAAAKELRSTPRKMRTCVDALQTLGNLTIKTTNKFSTITITNWERYQSREDASDQQNDQQATSKRPTSDHKQEGKEGKEGKEKTYTPLPPTGGNGSVPKKGPVLQTHPYPDWLNRDLFADFTRMRSRIKKPITTTKTITGLLTKLEKLIGEGHSQEALIQEAIDHCWMSFYPPKKDGCTVNADGNRVDRDGREWIA